MDKNTLIVLRADLTSQLAVVKSISLLIEERAEGLQKDDPIRLESIAYQIHNFYNAIEDLLKIVAAHFENQISDTARWHSILLKRMSQEIPGIRPVLLSQESYLLLNTLRGFRHFFRHAYGVPIDYEQLRINLNKSRQLYPCLERDLYQFFEALK